ncbi:hypothetical protein OAM75_00035 [Gammaproteobacteria bacterium]|jgi:hypothetical protein|nr:hypothetical protein [Pseudomonadales bacterium]MDC0413336.1 hypothetical protein [Gammaproteobacteria bacterium]
MSDEDIDTLVAWVDAGSPFGNQEDLPGPKQYPVVGEWRLAEELGQPDHVIQSTKWDVPGTGQDMWWEPEVDTGITESRCLRRPLTALLTMQTLTSWLRTKRVSG